MLDLFNRLMIVEDIDSLFLFLIYLYSLSIQDFGLSCKLRRKFFGLVSILCRYHFLTPQIIAASQFGFCVCRPFLSTLINSTSSKMNYVFQKGNKHCCNLGIVQSLHFRKKDRTDYLCLIRNQSYKNWKQGYNSLLRNQRNCKIPDQSLLKKRLVLN